MSFGSTSRTRFALALPLILLPLRVTGQVSTQVRGAALYESYDFAEGLGFQSVSESSLAFTAVTGLGSRATLTLATGYASISADREEGGSSTVSGALDSEVRLGYDAVPGTLTVFGTATLPTGIESLVQDDLSLLGILATDVIGFSSPSLGTGGGLGGGFAFAAPAGDLAFGAALSFQSSFAYSPVSGSEAELKPGADVRVRVGLEGPVAQRSFLRVSGMFATHGNDAFGGEPTPGIGNRFSGYASLDQGVGSSALTFYVFDLYRAEGGLDQTAVGTSFLPRGNIFATGAQLSYPLTSQLRVTPRAEFRDSRAATELDPNAMEKLGSATRFGLDLRYQFSPTWAVVAQGERLTGSVARDGSDIDVSGYRFSAHVEVNP